MTSTKTLQHYLLFTFCSKVLYWAS